MADWSSQQPLPPLFLHTYSRYSAGSAGRILIALGAGSTTWVANHCVYIPMSIPWDYPVRRVFWINGSTASSNAAFAIYTRDDTNAMTQIYTTGSVGQSGASAPQFTTPTEFVLPAGNYFFACSYSGTTNRGWGSTSFSSESCRFIGQLQQGTAHPPPQPATPVAATQALMALCGVTMTTTGY